MSFRRISRSALLSIAVGATVGLTMTACGESSTGAAAETTGPSTEQAAPTEAPVSSVDLTDQGPNPYVIDIEEATLANDTHRTALWTGTNLQMTVMSIPPGQDIGLELHEGQDQFLRVEAGTGRVQMGPERDDLSFDREVSDDWVILIPGGYWHNVTNIGDTDLKVYSLYGPPEHDHGTVHQTKADDDHDHE